MVSLHYPGVVGIDPSLTGTGIAYIDGTTTVVRTKMTGDSRLLAIANAVATAVEDEPLLAVLEDLPTHAHGAGKTGMVQGVVRLALLENRIDYVTVTPATLKKFATGNGGANKGDMRMELYKRVGIDLADDNEVDAWWLRALGHHLIDDPIVDLPKAHTAALAKVAVPDLARRPVRDLQLAGGTL